MKNKKYITGISIVLISFVLYLVLRTPDNLKNTEVITLRIPDSKFMGLLPLYVADEEGFFSQNGIEVEWVQIKDPGQAEKAFQAGHTDLNATTFANLLLAEIRKPGNISLFIPTSETSDRPGSYLLVRNDSKIQNVHDLKGKKIGTYSGPSQRAYAQIVLAKIGLNYEEDYELVQVSGSSQIQSLFGETFDALFTVEPYGSVAINQGARKIAEGVRTKYIGNPFWVGAFEVKREYSLDSIRMNKIITSLDHAIKFISNNEIQARKTLAKRTNITLEVAQICNLYNWTVNPSEEDIIQMQNLVNLMVEQKLLSKQVNIRELLQ